MDLGELTDGPAVRAQHRRAQDRGADRGADPEPHSGAADPAQRVHRAAAAAAVRVDAELAVLNRSAEHADVEAVLGPVLGAVLGAALRAALLTSGLVDPTTGDTLRRVRHGLPPRPAPGIGAVDYDPVTRRVRLARGTVLDLTAVAQAWAAQRNVTALALAHPGRPLLHRVGGTLAVTGPTADPAALLAGELAGDVDLDAADWADLLAGGRRGVAVVDGRADVVVNPVTGAAAASPWRRVVVVADDAVAAQAYARAAHVLGAAAPSWVAACGAEGVFWGLETGRTSPRRGPRRA